MNLVIWMYWEGKCPPWVKACQRTILEHGPLVRLLAPADFDRLWKSDRDIDLKRLYVSHRADFIRAYLLARHGGIWVDSDCIVLQDLHPLLEMLRTHEFLGYRNPQGQLANNFMGARSHSAIAETYYQTVCQILRSKQPLQWLTLGSNALDRVVRETDAKWLCLDRDRIEPIAWSEPHRFFKRGNLEVHEEALTKHAYCYMLSRHMINAYKKDHPHENLMADDSFFTFLLRRAFTKGAAGK